jgi:glycosyltransferase involved in cell wall biosynthesis
LSHPPLVSVVTPVYNGAAFLRQSIESVLSQSYENWDLTIVDNRSTDETLDIAREYAAGDPRIRVSENRQFVRVAENYNNALRQISPESAYCKVLAADDWLAKECLEKMVALAEANPRVAIVGAYGLTGSYVEWQGLPYSSTVINGSELCRDRLLGGPYVFGTPTSLLYRSDIVRSTDPFYNESNLHFDSEACMRELKKNDFGFIHQILSYRGVQKDSLSSFSMRMQTYLVCDLLELVRYGPVYLSPEEVESRIEKHLRKYYGYLAEQFFVGRDKEFWNYHRAQLAAQGYPLSRRRLARAAASRALDFVNPKTLLRVAAAPLRRVIVQA